MLDIRFPTELLAQVLGELDFLDLLQCRLVCRRFLNLINESTHLQLTIELAAAGFQPAGSRAAPSSESLRRLRALRAHWRNLRWEKIVDVPLMHTRSGLYELAGGLFISGRRIDGSSPVTTRHVLILDLPSCESTDVPRWSERDLGVSVSDLALDRDQDLLVLVQDSDQLDAPFRVDLRSLESNAAHPRAAQPIIEYLTNVDFLHFTFEIQIAEEHLAILFCAGFWDPQAQDRLVVWDWTTGEVKCCLVPFNRRYETFVFLSKNMFLLPNPADETLCIYSLSPDSTDPRLIRVLCLPETQDESICNLILCRSEPCVREPSRTYPKYHQQFQTASGDGIVAFSVYHMGPDQRHVDATLIVRRHALLDLALDPKLPSSVPWNVWGRKNARWLDRDKRPPRWVRYVHGYKFATLLTNGDTSTPSRIRVLDFSPYVSAPVPGTDISYLDREVRLITEETVVPAEDIFKEDIVSSLPYHQVTTTNEYLFASVLIDDERLIGMKTRVNAFDVTALEMFVM